LASRELNSIGRGEHAGAQDGPNGKAETGELVHLWFLENALQGTERGVAEPDGPVARDERAAWKL
jgi:hypothetical protein